MTAPAPTGLRERKRLATRRALHFAALTLASDRGLDNVTIDDIATTADVSPRTFFNYFGSKEAAILGDGFALADEAAQEKFVHGASSRGIIADLGEMIAVSAEHVAMDPDALRLQRALHKQYPQLSALFLSGRRQLEDKLAALVLLRLEAHNESQQVDVAAAASRAQLVTLVAVAAMRHGWINWASAGTAITLGESIRHAFVELDSLGLSAEAK